jgi:predicted DNA binding protein
MLKSSSDFQTKSLDLRVMNIEFAFPTGSKLPNFALTERFEQIEFITMVREEPDGMVCYAKLTFKTPEDLVESNDSFTILSIKSQNENSAIAIIKIKGPISMMFHDDDEVWWVSPTVLHSTGLTLTIQGTRGGLKRTRDKLSLWMGKGFSVKLGSDSTKGRELQELLPEKQKMVLSMAIEMGYYSRPRGCTQRDIAKVMDIKQATVSEHLQGAESKIINSLHS